MIAHKTHDTEDGRLLAWVYPASQASVDTILKAKEGDLDGRSEWTWVRLANGDLFLGVFPHGDTYMEVSDDDGQIPDGIR